MASKWASKNVAGRVTRAGDLIIAMTGLISLVKIAGAKDQPKGKAMHS